MLPPRGVFTHNHITPFTGTTQDCATALLVVGPSPHGVSQLRYRLQLRCLHEAFPYLRLTPKKKNSPAAPAGTRTLGLSIVDHESGALPLSYPRSECHTNGHCLCDSVPHSSWDSYCVVQYCCAMASGHCLNILFFWRRSTASLVFGVGACLESSLFLLPPLSPSLTGLLASVDVKNNYSHTNGRAGDRGLKVIKDLHVFTIFDVIEEELSD